MLTCPLPRVRMVATPPAPPTSMAARRGVAVLLSGERRTFDEQARPSIVRHLLCSLASHGYAVHAFDCADGEPLGGLDGCATVVVMRSRGGWQWPTSAGSDRLIQFERNHRCFARVEELEIERNVRFDAVIKSRPDVRINRPLDWGALLGAQASRVVLAKARCWPAGHLPRLSWTYGHTRCGDVPLSDDAFLVIPRRSDASLVFSTFDDELMRTPYPRCNVSFKATVAAECVFTTHLRRRGITFAPTPIDVSIASMNGATSPAATPPQAASQPHQPAPRLEICATEDAKGVCRVAVPFIRELLSTAIASLHACADGAPFRALQVIVGCDNAPALSFTDAAAGLRSCQHTMRVPPPLGTAQLAVMVLKEPLTISHRFYHRASWRIDPSTLVVDAFGSSIPLNATDGPSLLRISDVRSSLSLRVAKRSAATSVTSHPLLSVLVAPWAALSYASRRRSPWELYHAPTSPQTRHFCAFMGVRPHDDRGTALWGLEGDALRTIAPGYAYRDELLRALNCSHLQPRDRGARAATADGAMQTGPFNGTLPHYTGHRFVLAVENTHAGSPISEKIINAFLAGAIPVVWGGGAHSTFLNPHSFVDCSALTVAACARFVRDLDADGARRDAMRAMPRFANRAAFEGFFAWASAPLGEVTGGVAAVSEAQRELRRELGARLGLLAAHCTTL